MALVERVHAAEAEKTPDKTGLSNAVAKAYFKLLAVKDEYEVARLYTDGSFERALKREFEGPVRLSFHMAPPLFARRDPATGELQKQTFGPSISRGVMAAFRLMAGLKGLRGTAFDIFGYTAERKGERRMIRDYEAVVEELIQGLGPDTHGLAVEIAGLPLSVRGFGHVKERNRLDAKASEEQLLAGFRNGATDLKADAAE